MRKIIVIGCPGSGKSTFSRELHAKTKIPLFHLDAMYWNADKTTVERTAFLEKLSAAMSGESWIIDGNYASTMEMRMSACDTVFFLDYSLEVCLDGIKNRRGIKRSDMPWIEENEDSEFIEFVKGFNDNERPKILALLKKYGEKNIVIFKSREEALELLKIIDC